MVDKSKDKFLKGPTSSQGDRSTRARYSSDLSIENAIDIAALRKIGRVIVNCLQYCEQYCELSDKKGFLLPFSPSVIVGALTTALFALFSPRSKGFATGTTSDFWPST